MLIDTNIPILGILLTILFLPVELIRILINALFPTIPI